MGIVWVPLTIKGSHVLGGSLEFPLSWRSKRTLRKTGSNPSCLEGPSSLILRVCPKIRMSSKISSDCEVGYKSDPWKKLVKNDDGNQRIKPLGVLEYDLK